MAQMKTPVILLLLASLISCRKQEALDDLRLAQTENLYSLDPDRAADAQSRAILSNLYEALVEFDPDFNIRPALATSWNAPDEVTWIFEVRKGVKFHDGRELTATDVKASFERVGGPGIQDQVIGITGVDVLDNSHVRLRLAHPSPLLLNRITQVLIVPARVAFFQIDRPIGTGPYKFVEWTKNELQMEAFEKHWRVKPSIKRVSFAAFPARMVGQHFVERNLDVYRLLPAHMQSTSFLRIIGRSGLAMMYLWFNCASLFEKKKNPFGDMRVRQAISMALDRNRIVESLGGRDTPAHQPIPDGVFGFMPGWPNLPFDLNHSRKLMRDAGYPSGFATTLTHPPGESYDQLVRTIAEMLQPIGIAVRSKELGFVEFLEARRNQQLPFFAFTWTFDDGDAWTFLMASLHTKAGPADFRSTNPGYSNPQVDRLIEDSQQATSIHGISSRYESILRIAIAEAPIIPLYRRYDLYGVSKRVRFHPRLDGKLLAAEMQLQQN